MISFMGSCLNPAVPAISQDPGNGSMEIVWIITAYMLASAALPVPVSGLAGRISNESVLTSGLGLFAAASAGGMAAQSLKGLILFRILQGTGTALIYSTGMAVLTQKEEAAERRKLLGYSTAATCLGLTAGPAAGGVINALLGWRWIFTAAAALAGAAFLAAFFQNIRLKREARHIRSLHFSSSMKVPYPFGESVIYVISITLLITGLSYVSKSAWAWSAAAGGVFAGAYFIVKEIRSSRPLIPVKLFRKRPVLFCSCAAAMTHYGTGFGMNFMLSLYLQNVMGFSSQKAGLFLVIYPAVQSVVSVFAAKSGISTRFLSSAGMLGLSAAAAGLGFVKENGTIGYILLWTVCAGVFCGFFAAANTAVIMETAGERNRTTAAAILSTLRSLGNALSMAAVSSVSAAYIGQESLEAVGADMFLQIMQNIMFLWSGLCILGFFMALKKKM